MEFTTCRYHLVGTIEYSDGLDMCIDQYYETYNLAVDKMKYYRKHYAEFITMFDLKVVWELHDVVAYSVDGKIVLF